MYKVVQWFDESTQQGKSELLDIFEVTSPEPIRMMEISPKVSILRFRYRFRLFFFFLIPVFSFFSIRPHPAQIDLRHIGPSNPSSQHGHVQRPLRQLPALRTRSLLRLG